MHPRTFALLDAQRQSPAQGPMQGQLLEMLKARWTEHLVGLLDKLPGLLAIALVAFILMRLVIFLTNRLRNLSLQSQIASTVRASQIRTLASVLETAGYAVILFLTCVHILDIFGIKTAPLLASAGVVGVAIGFGAQTIVHDMLNGMLILLENQFNVGDTVKIAGLAGVVEMMSLRKVSLRDGNDGTLYTIPNSQITTVSNYSRNWSQIQVNISVDFREDADRVIKLLTDTAMQIAAEPQYESVVNGMPKVLGVDNLAGSQVIYPVVFKTQSGQQWGISRDFRRRVKAVFEQNHILPGDPLRIYNYPAAADTAPDAAPGGTEPS